MNEKEFYAIHHKYVYSAYHLYASKHRSQVFDHRLEVEVRIGRYLKPKEQVHHHYNKDGSATLVACENQAYHGLLHQRETTLRFSGHANWRKCEFCKQYDDPKNLTIKQEVYHKSCRNKYQQNMRKEVTWTKIK